VALRPRLSPGVPFSSQQPHVTRWSEGRQGPWLRVQGGTSLLYFFIVVSTAVDSFPVAGAAALFFLHAVMEPVAIATASSISSNLAFMACLL
jgi:hypothetical protein